MSPIIKEPDGPEAVPLNIDNGAATPFPEDINARSNALPPPTLSLPKNSSDSAENVTKESSNAATREREKNGQQSNVSVVHNSENKILLPEKRKGMKKQDKKDTTLKRSKSLRSQSSPTVSRNTSVQTLNPEKPVLEENDTTAPVTKHNKPGRFQMFKNRFNVFPKVSLLNDENDNKKGNVSFHNLRRSQSMRIPTKKSNSTSVSALNRNSLETTPESLDKSIASDHGRTHSTNSITNSKSLNDVRMSHKKLVTDCSLTSQNEVLNNSVKRTPNLTSNDRATTLKSKIKKSSEVSSTDKRSSPKNFAHKTIDVIRKSVQSKFSKGIIEKRNKNKVDSFIPLQKSQSEIINNSRKSYNKLINNSSKDKVKMNSKRKKNDGNESDTEFKPKKKAHSNEKAKLNPLFKELASKEKRINSPPSIPKDKSKDKCLNVDSSKKLNNTNTDKSKLKIRNKKTKGNKTNILNVKNINNGNVENTHTNNSSKLVNKNKNIINTNTCQNLASEMQSQHVIFLNNIHETLSNSHRSVKNSMSIKNLNFNEEKLQAENKFSKILNRNICEIISSRFSNSLPFIVSEFGVKNDKTIDYETEELNLTKSYSETCISERSMSMSVQEADINSASPMSFSNDDDVRSKMDLPSPMSFTNYDPYIDESMDDYWCEKEGEQSYFGTLFAETKVLWESFSESLHELDVDLSSGNIYLDEDVSLNNHKINDDSFLENESLNRSTQDSLCSDSIMKNQMNSNNFTTSLEPELLKKNLNLPLTSHKPLKNTKVSHNKIIKEKLDNEAKQKKNSFSSEESRPLHVEGNNNLVDVTSIHHDSGEIASNKKIVNSKKSIEVKHRRKSTSNVLKSNSTHNVNKVNMSKETPKHEAKMSSPILKSVTVKRKPSSEAGGVINADKKGCLTARKAKSELESRKQEGNGRSSCNKNENAKSFANLKSLQNEKAKTILKTDIKNEGCATSVGDSNSFGVRTPARERANRLPPPSRALSRVGAPTPGVLDDKKGPSSSSASSPAAALALARRAKIDTPKTAFAKHCRGASSSSSSAAATRTKQTDPVKILRPTSGSVGLNGHPPAGVGPPPSSSSSSSSHAHPPAWAEEHRKKLEAELVSRRQEAQTAKEDAARANRGVEALTVIVHYLTNEYDAFSTPQLKAEAQRLSSQLTDVRLCLDESVATARRLEDEARERHQKQADELLQLEQAHLEKTAAMTLQHQRETEEVLEKQKLELKDLSDKGQAEREDLLASHSEELSRIDWDWRSQMDRQHENHILALEQLNTCHTLQLRNAEAKWECREKEFQETNSQLLKEQRSLKAQAKNLEQTLLSDKDHRLQAAKRLCTAFQNEVDSLKTVVEMRNSEVHKLRDQLLDKERLSEELDAAREKVRALHAKTEDLHAQMEKKLQLERQLIAEHHSISDSLQREASINKRLSLDNEELQWKLRQREAASGSLPTSTLDLVTRCSSAIARQQEGCKNGVLSPQFTPRSQRIGTATRPHDKKWSQSFSNIPEDASKLLLRRTELQHDDVTLDESPPPSPRVKAVIEKSNSVSFILDLNDTFPDDPFLGIQSTPPHLAKKTLTPKLQRKSLRKTFSNNLEKSSSTSVLQRSSRSSFHRDFTSANGQDKSKLNGGGGDGGSENSEEGSAKAGGGGCLDLHASMSKYSRAHSTSESSDSGDVERISPTGLAWTVPVHSNAKRYSKHIPNRFHQMVSDPPRLLQQPDEDEYEEMENENEFVEVLTLAEDLSSAPLTTLFAQTPSTSVSLSDSDVSQCGSRVDLSTEDEDDEGTDDEGTLLQKESRPQEGAGEAMIFPDVFDLKGDGKGVARLKEISKSQISSAPSSDSEDAAANQPMNEEGPLNMSWSEDVECDLTSSSEMQELL